MAACSNKFSKRKYNNWVKAGLALLFTKEGIEPFVCSEIQQFQWKCLGDICYNNGLTTGTTCSTCCIENVVVCPTNRICNVGRGNCSFHRNNAKRYKPAGCPNKICHNFKNEIQTAHRYYGPAFMNTDATQWCSNTWEVAKCFMPPDGYKDVRSAPETDFNGMVSVVINYKDFQAKVSDNLSNKTNVFEKARAISREVRHSSNLEVDDADLQRYFADLQNLLSDPRHLATDTDAQNAIQKLIQLQNDTLIIGKDEVRKVLDDVGVAVQDRIKKQIDAQKSESEKQNLEVINASKDSLKAIKGQESISAAELKDTLSSILSQIETKSEESKRKLEEKTEDGVKKISEKSVDILKTTNRAVKTIEDKTCEANEKIEEKSLEGLKQMKEENKRIEMQIREKTDEQVVKIENVSQQQKTDLIALSESIHDEIDQKGEELRLSMLADEQKIEDRYRHLQEDLIQHYREHCNALPISPLMEGVMDAPLLKMYVPPFPMVSAETNNLKYINKKQKVSVHAGNEAQVKTLHDVFHRKSESCKNIFVTAEPGYGKSSFVYWLVLTWCQARSPSKEFEHSIFEGSLEQMQEFEFVFLVLLRDVHSEEHRVERMIKNNVISLLRRQSQYSLMDVENILSTKKCLIVLDGLDEWNYSDSPNTLPTRAASDTCTVITTSRPWKMASVSIKSSQIDQHIQITNLKDMCIEKLVPKVISLFKDNECLRSDCKEQNLPQDSHFNWRYWRYKNHELRTEICCFLEMLVHKKIEQFATSPVMLLLILHLWNFERTVGNSQCEIYSNIVDTLLSRAIEKGTVPSLMKFKHQGSSSFSYYGNEAVNCETYYRLLLYLGKLAFETLFGDRKESSLVFHEDEVRKYLAPESNEDVLKTAVKVGLLSQFSSISARRKEYNYSFYHKTIQEYFVALYIQSLPGNWHVMDTIKKRCNSISSILEMGTVFMFLSGFNPGISCDVIQNLQGTISDEITLNEIRSDISNSIDELEEIQGMVINCVEEYKSNGHGTDVVNETQSYNAVRFPLEDIIIDDSCWRGLKGSCMRYIILCNAGKIKSLYIDSTSVFSVFRCITYPVVEGLETLVIMRCDCISLLDILPRLTHLKHTYLGYIDLSKRPVLSTDMKYIQHVQLCNVSLTISMLHMIVYTALKYEHSVTVELKGIIVTNDSSMVQKLPTLNHKSGRKEFKFFYARITSKILLMCVDTLIKNGQSVTMKLSCVTVEGSPRAEAYEAAINVLKSLPTSTISRHACLCIEFVFAKLQSRTLIVLVDTILKCQHFVKVKLDNVIIEDVGGGVKHTVNISKSVSPKFTDNRCSYGKKELELDNVTLTDRSLQELFGAVSKY